jgi:signal-transduction protein with cAMP-binding, CBS, and nucleotidyltransferase domain
MKLSEFMTTKIEYIVPGATVYDVVEKMVDRRIRSLVVRSPDERDGHGVITARDVVFKVLAKGIDPSKVKAEELASKPLICIDEEARLADAIDMMEAQNIARIFVCRNGQIVGVVAMLDIMWAVLIKRARGEHVSQ